MIMNRDNKRESPWEIRQSCVVGNMQARDNKRAQGLTLDPT